MQFRKPNAERGLGGITKIVKQIDAEINRHDEAIVHSQLWRSKMQDKADLLEHRFIVMADNLFNIVERVVQRLETWTDKRRTVLDERMAAAHIRELNLDADRQRLDKARAKVVETLAV